MCTKNTRAAVVSVNPTTTTTTTDYYYYYYYYYYRLLLPKKLVYVQQILEKLPPRGLL